MVVLCLSLNTGFSKQGNLAEVGDAWLKANTKNINGTSLCC
jgi:hypothetical protein